jgi:hypothetical protein
MKKRKAGRTVDNEDGWMNEKGVGGGGLPNADG